MTLLTELCFVMRLVPLGMVLGLGELVTCFYGPALTFAFPNALLSAYRLSVILISLISISDSTRLCEQSVLTGRMSCDVLFGNIQSPDLIELNVRNKLNSTKCLRMEGHTKDPVEVDPIFGTFCH